MSETFRLGRILGVRVGVNWSVLIIFGLIVVGLAAGRFPFLYPDRPAGAYLVAGLFAGLVFFASLLAHELAHAVVARRNGVGVEAITLWLFGGVAKLEGEPDTPGADFRVAAVGPGLSLALAVVFALAATALAGLGVDALVVGSVAWLAIINFVLAVFNLVPAAPLDGGRILRAAIWWRTGDRLRAAVGASRAGWVFGWALVVLGVAAALGGLGPAGLWLALIGWFIATAARNEEQYARMSGALGHLRVGELMTGEPTVVPADVDVQHFIDDWVFTHRYSTFPVVDRLGNPVGLVTLARVKQVPAAHRVTTPVSSVAAPLSSVAVVAPTDRVTDVLPRMSGGAEGRALVIDGGRLVGLLSPTDVTHRLQLADAGVGAAGSRWGRG
jgi:Zn-dependent protease/CBS domain-containing protein